MLNGSGPPSQEFYLRGTDGGLPRWGSRITIFSKFCFGPKIVPKSPFWVGIGPFGPKNHEESESGLKKQTKIKKTKNWKIVFRKKNEIRDPHRGRPPSVPLQSSFEF